ncbi:MAG: DUF975 family protein [Acetanaerobacterium sp.]
MNMIGKMKKNARLLLRGNLARGAAITLVLLAVAALFKGLETVCLLVLDMLGVSAMALGGEQLNSLLSMLPLVSPVSIAVTTVVLLLGFMVAAPLYLGIKRWFYLLSRGEDALMGEIFYFFAHARLFFKSILLLLDIFLRAFFWVYILILPGALLGTTGTALLTARLELKNGELMGTLAVILGALLAVLGLALGLTMALRYFLAPFLFAENSEQSVRCAVRTSVHYMRGGQARLLGLLCSFLPWAAVSVLILPALYAYPYAQSTFAIFARYTIEKGRLQGEQEDPGQAAQPDRTADENPAQEL